MNYLTAEELALKWNISVRRITKLCNEGRLTGAIKKGLMWLIPENVKKPEDRRKVPKSGQ